MFKSITFIGIVLFLLYGYVCIIANAIRLERKDFNNGIYPHCGQKLRYFDSASDGSRGYVCDNCGYDTWCSYNVDEYYRNKKFQENKIKILNSDKSMLLTGLKGEIMYC